jgi:predicted dehydrogenase/serine acetyltransferase
MNAPSLPAVAVVGCGLWGRNLVRNFAELGALTAVADADADAALRLADQHGVPSIAVDEVWASAAVEAVVIAAPAARHHELTMQALEAGKHVYCEKPLALDVGEAEKAVAFASECDRILMVGHLLQYHPAFLKLGEIVADGELGRMQYLYSNRLNLGRIRREEDILWSFAPHDISMILALVGAEPDAIAAYGGRFLHKSIADVTTTHLSFPGGEQAHVFVSWLHPFKEQKLVVVGDRGMAVFDDGEPWDSKLVVYRHRIDWHDGVPDPVKADAEPVALTAGEPLRAECQHFLDCVRDGTTPRTDGQEGVRVLRVLQTAGSAMQINDGAAMTWATRATLAGALPGDVFIHPTAVVDDDVEIGSGSKIWHFCHLMSGSRLGQRCSLGQNVMVGPNVSIGDGCRIQNNVSVYEGVELGTNVFCGPSAVFTNVRNPRASVERKSEFLPTLVGDEATIGANATIVCGNRLGSYSFVAAGAVVTADVAPHALVAGVPAKQIGWVSHEGEVLGDDLVCPRSGRRYDVVDGSLTELR